MKRFALGLHHLNIAYCAGDERSYHRQVRESIIPFLNLLKAHPSWSFSVEMSGFSVEFIADNYPEVLNDLRDLIFSGQVELISCTYAPQIWIAFPKYDLIKSVKINQQLLSRYNLKASRIFFSQENFVGEGIRCLGEWFDIVVVKDDYYYHFYPHPKSEFDIVPFYDFHGMKLCIGWGHILEEFSWLLKDRISRHECTVSDFRHYNQNVNTIDDASERAKKSFFFHRIAKHEDIEWTWYHVGSSERFSKIENRPQNLLNCRYDPTWLSRIEEILLDYHSRGFHISGIGNFLNALPANLADASRCETLIDGAWNMKNSSGAFIWMGLNNKPHEDVLLVRNHNWFSRSKLLGLQTALSILDIPNPPKTVMNDEVEIAWKHQLLAESSDATGWYPELSEVEDSIFHSEKVLNIVASITTRLMTWQNEAAIVVDTYNKVIQRRLPVEKAAKSISSHELLHIAPQFSGGRHRMNFYSIDQNHQQIHLSFLPDEPMCRLSFDLQQKNLVFSPALLEDELVSLNISDLIPELITLSLTNGLLQLKEDVFVIKHNEYLNIACRVEKLKMNAQFEIHNPKKRPHFWVFTLFRGGGSDALNLAQSINVNPIVVL